MSVGVLLDESQAKAVEKDKQVQVQIMYNGIGNLPNKKQIFLCIDRMTQEAIVEKWDSQE